MTIEFYNYGKFYFTLYGIGFDITYDGEYNLDEVMHFIEFKFEQDFHYDRADIMDAETGEVVATVLNDIDDEEDEFDDYEDDVDECSFNVYLGCYDFDC